jgi:hypothetical protein
VVYVNEYASPSSGSTNTYEFFSLATVALISAVLSIALPREKAEFSVAATARGKVVI